MPFTRPDLQGVTRYFLAARLKHSRYMVVQWTRDMELETLIRGLLRVFERIGGVPWVVTFDNMRQVTTGRNVDGQPLWTPAFRKVAAAIGFHPVLCALNAHNQKGADESLVGFVKHNFVAERSFLDDVGLSDQQDVWLDRVNAETSQAHGARPIDVLATEQAAFSPLTPGRALRDPAFTQSHAGIGDPSRDESLQPAGRVHRAGGRGPRRGGTRPCLPRSTGDRRTPALPLRNQRIRERSHYEEVLQRKPRARVMLYREELLELDPVIRT